MVLQQTCESLDVELSLLLTYCSIFRIFIELIKILSQVQATKFYPFPDKKSRNAEYNSATALH